MTDLMQTVRRMRPRTPPSPWRQGNRFELLEDTDQFFGRMLAAIGTARECVLLEMYLVESGTLADRFIDALTAAAGRGVKVAVLLDGFGALGLRGDDRERLVDAGVDLRFYNVLGWRKSLANFLRDHRKLLLVDGAIGFAGSAGITDDVAGVRSRHPWHDLMVQIEGPVLADWLELSWSK